MNENTPDRRADLAIAVALGIIIVAIIVLRALHVL